MLRQTISTVLRQTISTMLRTRLLAAALLPAAAMAQAPQCWISYEGFHDHVSHIDLDMCPGNAPTAEEGFCRVAIAGDTIHIYVFRHNPAANGACLTQVVRQDLNSFMASRGTTYIKP